MKTMRTALSCFGVFVLLALTTAPARAGDTDCSISGLTCGFGTTVAGTAAGPLVSLGGFTATFSETVYKNAAGVFTYVYTITDVAGATLHAGSTGTGVFPALLDLFNPALNFGIVTDLTSLGNDDSGFIFDTNVLHVGFGSGVAAVSSLTFYAQSKRGPGAGALAVFNSGTSAHNVSLDPVSEPTLASLLGSSLVFILGVPLAGWLRQKNS